MSNVLCPIVARYSLFFTLALSDSSRLARSKHPRQVVHELVLEAQERFQAHHHASATRKKALIRNASAASTSTHSSLSSSTSSSTFGHNTNSDSAPAPGSATASASATASSSSAPSSSSSPSSSPSPSSPSLGFSTPPKSSICKECNSVCPCGDSTTSQPCASVFPGNGKTSDTGSPEEATTTAADPAHVHIDRHHAAAARTLPSPPPSPLICSAEEEHGLSLITSPSSPITPLSALHSAPNCPICLSADSSPPARSSPAQIPRRAPRLANADAHTTTPDKIVRRRHRTKLISFTTLLSIAFTVIFLSLLQTRRRNLRKKSPRSHHQSVSKHRRHKTPSLHPDDMFDPQFPSIRPKRRKHHTNTSRTMSTIDREVAVVAITADDETGLTSQLVKDEYTGTWLGHHSRHLSEASAQPMPSWEAADDIQMQQELSLAYRPSFDSSQEHSLNPDTSPHNIYPTDIHYQHHHHPGLRHTLSDPDTHTTMMHYRPSGEFTDPASQLHHYRVQHFPYVDQHHQYAYPQNRRNSFIPPMEEASPLAYAQPMKSANQLAWERHNYYQRLQDEEEEQALRIRQERLRQQQYHVQQLSRQRQAHQESSTMSGSSVARTGSLNRLSSPPLLSTETSRLLGLCRSNTLSAAVKRLSLTKKDKDSSSSSRPSSRSASRPCSPSSVAEEDEDDIYSYSSSTNRNADDINMSGTNQPLLTRKKTLKEHLTPSFRSLARHCSQRFSNGGRPLSFAGARSDPVLQQQEYPVGRHSLGSRPSDHMSDFKPLQVGPETSEILKQQQGPTLSHQEQKVPVHRKVTLFRSMSTRVSGSVSMTRGMMENMSLPMKRNSLRLANGRGLDFLCEDKTATTPSTSEHSCPSPQQQQEEEQQQQQKQKPVPSITTSEVLESNEADEEEHESMRKQISAIIALGRRDTRRRRSLGSRASTPTPCLSPLAVEAQEYFSDSPTGDDESDDDDDEPAEEGVVPFCDLPAVTMETGLKDACEHIAFMLVPKSRYEFQPLVVQ